MNASSWNLLLDIPVVLRNPLSEIVDSYDIWLLDQFGVLHNGQNALPGAIAAVQYLLSKDKRIVVCSNSSQRKKLASERWKSMGFPLQGVEIITSGELSCQMIAEKERTCEWKKVFAFGWTDSKLTNDYLATSSLEQLEIENVESADFILFHGPNTMGKSREPIDVGSSGTIGEKTRSVLQQACSRGIPAVCANVDIKAVTENGIRYMPGVLMKYYASIGGTVHCFGKPYAQCFETALGLAVDSIQSTEKDVVHLALNGAGAKNMPQPGKRIVRAIHVGDSLQHDIAGARASRIDSLLITSHGIHCNDFHALMELPAAPSHTEGRHSCKESPASLLRAVCDYCEREGEPTPTFIASAFTITA